jgi:hypothetical protein
MLSLLYRDDWNIDTIISRLIASKTSHQAL